MQSVINLTSGPITQAIEGAIERGWIRGAVVAVAQQDLPIETIATGVDAAGQPLAPDSLLPVASITKLATALAVLRLAAAEALDIDDRLGQHLPEIAASGGVTLRRVLCHTAGLADDVSGEAAPYALGLDWPALARACLAAPPVGPPGERVRYSNIGPGLLAIIVERLTSKTFSAALDELVFYPLGLEAYLGVDPPRPPACIGGDLGQHTGTDLEPFNSSFWRSLALPWGGLITSMADALALARAFAGVPAGFLPAELLAEARRDQTGGLGGGMGVFGEWPHCPWGLGVELRDAKMPHWTPASASAASFGHAGASGCVVWVDPTAGIGWAIHVAQATGLALHTVLPRIGEAILKASTRTG
jgi:CubicO group peptidase (beta-lactamase class C family)